MSFLEIKSFPLAAPSNVYVSICYLIVQSETQHLPYRGLQSLKCRLVTKETVTGSREDSSVATPVVVNGEDVEVVHQYQCFTYVRYR